MIECINESMDGAVLKFQSPHSNKYVRIPSFQLHLLKGFWLAQVHKVVMPYVPGRPVRAAWSTPGMVSTPKKALHPISSSKKFYYPCQQRGF